MKVLVFDLKGGLAHFRRPDTTNTHATYPFIPYTSVRGLAGSILGMDEFQGSVLTGIQIISPVRTTVQQMSMLGKGWLGSGSEFNRPTAIELLVNPSYRIYWTGDHTEQLTDYIKSRRSMYHTYLGSAFALTFPDYVGVFEGDIIEKDSEITCCTVVPIDLISRLKTTPGTQYSRVGGMHYEFLGDRCFGRTGSILYEPLGQCISFKPKTSLQFSSAKFCLLETGDIICLW